VAGRAGRSERGGQVVIQTYQPNEAAIVAAAQHDYRRFFERELAFRGEHMYPPYSRFVRLEIQSERDATASKRSQEMARQVSLRIRQLGLRETEVIGPAPCYFRRVRGKYRWQVLVRTPEPQTLFGDWAFSPGWRVDVDPVSTL
jgi:primosomal protein N' (replication factor Y)